MKSELPPVSWTKNPTVVEAVFYGTTLPSVIKLKAIELYKQGYGCKIIAKKVIH